MLVQAPASATGRTRPVLLRPGWPVVAAFGGFPLWWALGAGSFVWIAAAIPMIAWLSVRRRVALPRGFGVWLLFLAWMTVTATQLDSPDRLLGFVFRLAQYGSLTVLLVYLYNLPRDVFPLDRAVRVLVVYWVFIVIGGLVAVVAPDTVLPSLTASLLPARVLANEFVTTLVTPEFAQVQDFLGYPLARPAAPFPYANTWGASFALLLPVVWAYAVWRPRHRAWPVVMVFVLASLVPAIMSVNRGMWASIAVGLLAATLLTRDRRLRATLSRALVAPVVITVSRSSSPPSISNTFPSVSPVLTARWNDRPFLTMKTRLVTPSLTIAVAGTTIGSSWDDTETFTLQNIPGLNQFSGVLSKSALIWNVRERTSADFESWTILPAILTSGSASE